MQPQTATASSPDALIGAIMDDIENNLDAPDSYALIPAEETRRLNAIASRMTEWRRRQSGLLPPAISINDRNYDLRREIAAILRARAAGATDEMVRELVRKLVAARKAAVAV
jgi:hypothetical protein